MGAAFLHGAAVTIHKAQGSQWPEVQVFAPDLWAAAQAGRSEAGVPLWKRLAYVAITRAETRLHWVVGTGSPGPRRRLVSRICAGPRRRGWNWRRWRTRPDTAVARRGFPLRRP
jgi:exodeoxyribonuclease-5